MFSRYFPIETKKIYDLFIKKTRIYISKAYNELYSLVETAKANGADPYYYLKYLLDMMPAHMDDHDRSFLADMMPWSEAFKTYAEKEKAELIQRYRLNGSDEPPIHTRCRSGPNKKATA